MSEIQGSRDVLTYGVYMHPDGTMFRRTPFGFWSGSDGTQVNETYIEYRLFVDAEDAADERMSA